MIEQRPVVVRVGTVRRTASGWVIEGWVLAMPDGVSPEMVRGYSGDELREIARAALTGPEEEA